MACGDRCLHQRQTRGMPTDRLYKCKRTSRFHIARDLGEKHAAPYKACRQTTAHRLHRTTIARNTTLDEVVDFWLAFEMKEKNCVKRYKLLQCTAPHVAAWLIRDAKQQRKRESSRPSALNHDSHASTPCPPPKKNAHLLFLNNSVKN